MKWLDTEILACNIKEFQIYIYIYLYSPAICMNRLDIEIFTCNMHELARYRQRVPRVEFCSNRLTKNSLGHRVFSTPYLAELVPSSYSHTCLTPDHSPSCQSYLALLHSPLELLSPLSGLSVATLIIQLTWLPTTAGSGLDCSHCY